MVNDIIKSYKKITIGKLFADGGAYDSNDIFRYLGDSGIQPCIKLRKNARIRLKKGKNIIRNLSVLDQKSDLQGWKDSVSGSVNLRH